MRITQKKDILEIINTLHQAQDEIKRNIAEKEYAFAQDMLGQCQECAISIGEAVEASEGEGFVTVSYVEEYCDVLYHVHEELNAPENISANKLYKTLRKSLLKIENSIKNDVPAKKEIVFLPYKASMWDSLESVWRAADADPECEAYVVPISYYDKNPDGSFGKEHYEGELFPADVPIVHYKAYDIEKRHPDIVFIHNPYDGNNYVTSVHPSFYSDKLKACCEKLIYIPYYVSEETNPDAPEIMEAKTGFVLSGGVLNADMVVVQSENTKKLYINILEKTFPNVERRFWEQKIQGLGSPKLDRVVSIQRDDEKLPENWQKIIYTKDGVRKKTIFYNISIAALLENSDMLEKIKDVLAFFKKNQDVALWWRPHPLYESTLASMRPALLREYQEITRQYKEEAWGIFDEGVDLEWAIAETDAYYGDSSSVVQLYKEVGKPIMYQDVSVRAGQEIKAEDMPIWPSAFCVDGNDIWFVHGKINALMRYNMKDNYTYVIGLISKEKIFGENLYSGIYKWKNNVYLIPNKAREIKAYSIKESRFQEILITEKGKCLDEGLFSKVYVKNNYLYCIPSYYNSILKFNMENRYIEYIKIDKGQQIVINDSTRIGNIIGAVDSLTNQVIFLDMESDEIYIKKLGDQKRTFSSIANIKNNLYVFDKFTSSIIKIYAERGYVEDKFYKTSQVVRLENIFLNKIIISAVFDSQKQLIDNQEKITLINSGEQNIRKSSLHSSNCVGVVDNNYIFSDISFYFSKVTYSMYQLRESIIEKNFIFYIQIEEFNKLKHEISNVENLEIEENQLYNLVTWKNQLERRQSIIGKSREICGKKILQAVKENR